MKKTVSIGLITVTIIVLGLGFSGCDCGCEDGVYGGCGYIAPVSDTNQSTQNEVITTIISPITAKVWMDRNLGATMVCDAERDSFADNAGYIASQQACFGNYYQWGRAADGHEKSNSATVEVDSNQTCVNPGHAKFITDGDGNSDDGAELDWISNDASGSKRASWNPCPTGFRIPTRAEIDAEYDNGNGIANRSDAFDKLKLPSAGFRSFDDGSLHHQGSYGSIWSSGVSGSYSDSLNFNSAVAVTNDDYRANGLSVRCFKD